MERRIQECQDVEFERNEQNENKRRKKIEPNILFITHITDPCLSS